MALLATHRLSLPDLKELARSMGPVVAGIALVPTLACAAGAEPPPSWPQLPLSHDVLMRHFTHAPAKTLALNMTRPNWWTLATSSLCHVDASHRDNNLLGVLSAGWKPATALGPVGFALTFFGGHACAALNTVGHELQRRNWINAKTGSIMGPSLTSHAAKLWSSVSVPQMLGSSAGVFALLGFDLCLIVDEGLKLMNRWDDARDGSDERLFALAWMGVNLHQIVARVLSEQRSLGGGASVSVSHVGHLTGFAWGLFCFGAHYWYRRARVRASRVRATGGRRLGGR